MVTPASLKFCDFNSQEFEQLYRILSKVFDTSQEELRKLYKNIDCTFNEPDWPKHFTSRDFFKSADDKFHSKYYEQSHVIAVDLPSLLELEDGQQNKPTIAIIAQDSLQSGTCKDIIVGTPYGLHHKDSRENLARTKLYFDMILVLLNLGYRVYLTDIYKIWVGGKKIPKVDQDRFCNIIRNELEVVKPVALITWGQVAGRAVDQLNLGYDHQNFLHPSGANNGAWRKLMQTTATNENKLAYWHNEMVSWDKARKN